MSELTGRALDAEVATQCFGYTCIPGTRNIAFEHPVSRNHVGVAVIPHYSTSMAAAWQVVEHLVKKYPSLTFQLSTVHDKWEAYFSDFDADACIEADEPALAICVAALDIEDAKADALEMSDDTAT